MFKKLKVTIEGSAPLIMHNGEIVDHTNPVSRKLSKLQVRGKKTEDQLNALREAEWHAGLYKDENGRPTLPPEVIEACIVNGSKKSKLGPKFKASFFVESVDEFDGNEPGTADEIYARGTAVDYRPVIVSRSKIMRSRPIFRNWKCTFTVAYDSQQIDKDEVIKAIRDGGQQCGVGDYRPKYGRFEVV